MNKEKIAVLLMNVGSPAKPKIFKVWSYLTEFLNDKKVIDLPIILRFFLVNFIIIPFRVCRSTGLYKKLWNGKSMPLISYSLKVKEKLQYQLGVNYEVFIGMRYKKPSYRTALSQIKKKGFSRLILIPLFPEYAEATSGTAIDAVKREIKKQHIKVRLTIIEQFYNHPLFIKTLAEKVRKYDLGSFSYVVFSYHGLPNHQLENIHRRVSPVTCNCDKEMPLYGKKCYRATCYANARLLAEELNLNNKDYGVSFQSRISKNWMKPFTNELLLEKLKQGKKRILILAPAFVTDCLETIVEIGSDYRKLFIDNGGEELQLVESVNDSNMWILTLQDMIANVNDQ